MAQVVAVRRSVSPEGYWYVEFDRPVNLGGAVTTIWLFTAEPGDDELRVFARAMKRAGDE